MDKQWKKSEESTTNNREIDRINGSACVRSKGPFNHQMANKYINLAKQNEMI